MKLLESPQTDAAWNLALEQYVFDELPRDESWFMLWRNRSAVIVGRHQNTWSEVDPVFCRENGIQVIRRLSGGGAVYHDLGNLNFTIITDADGAGDLDFRLFCAPVAAVLAKYGVRAEIGGRNDITVDGKKFSGNAQYVREGRVMHHGTILFQSDLQTVQRALTPSADKLESKGVASVRSRVCNLRDVLPPEVTMEVFRRRLAEELCGENAQALPLGGAALRRIRELCEERYARWEWNWGRSPAHAMVRRAYIQGVGSVEVHLDAAEGRLRDLRVFGDFFTVSPLEDLAGALRGVPLREEALRAALPAGPFPIRGMTGEQLLRLLVPTQQLYQHHDRSGEHG